MRNDAHDEINELPSLSAARHEPAFKAASTATFTATAPAQAQAQAQAVDHAAPSSKAVGVLSALTLALLCAGGTFAWWSMQRIALLEQQLIATQDSFSRISEDAAGRIKDITGKFTATESSVLGDNEILKMRLNKIESSAVEAAKQQQISLTEYASRLTKTQSELSSLHSTVNDLSRLSDAQKNTIEQQHNTLNSLQKELKTGLSEHSQQLNSLTKSHQDSQQQLAQLAEQKQNFKHLNEQLLALQKSSGTKDDLTRLQQDILILRSELEQRPAAAASNQGPSLSDFDAYRAQTNRTINTLQEQVRNLQKIAP